MFCERSAMAHPLLYSTPDMFDSNYLPCEEFSPWLGPGFQSSNSFIPDMELFYNVDNRVLGPGGTRTPP